MPCSPVAIFVSQSLQVRYLFEFAVPIRHVQGERPIARLASRSPQEAGGVSLEVAAGNRSREWNQGQNQMCDVGFVFPCASLGVLRPQSDVVRHSSRKWKKERTKYGGACQCQAPEVAVEIDGGASGRSVDTARIPRPASRISGRRTGKTSRRTGCTPSDGLQIQRPSLRRSTFLLLASGRASGR